jgi:hypothetical protein
MKISLLNSKGKASSVRISTDSYESIRDFILLLLQQHQEVTFNLLLDEASRNNTLKYEGDLSWCLILVKRDLEARGVIEIKFDIASSRVQIVKLVKRKRTSMAKSKLKAIL